MKWSENENWERPIDDKPTNELPGTQAKIEVMRDRVSREKCPHHPDDARYDEAVVERIDEKGHSHYFPKKNGITVSTTVGAQLTHIMRQRNRWRRYQRQKRKQ